MASREWMITKVIGAILGVVTLVSICIGGANVVVVMQKDISRIDSDVATHKADDSKRWDKAFEDIDELEDDVHGLQIADKELEMKYSEILRRLDEQMDQLKITNMKLDNLERVD